jgi:hypothetical protein
MPDNAAMSRTSMLLWAGGSLLVIIALMVFFLAVIDVDRTVPSNFTRGDQCEELNADGAIFEPQNTWSNLGYVLAGLMIFYRARRLLSMAVGLFLCLTGVFSAMYHAVPTNATLQMLDIAAVNWILLAMLGHAALSLQRHFHGTELDVVLEKLLAIISLVLGTVMAITRTSFVLFESTTATVTLVGVLAIFMCCGYFAAKDLRASLSTYEKVTYLSGVLMLAPFTAAFRLLDGRYSDGSEKPLCDAEGIFQAHALWHLLGALLLLIAFDYFARVANDADERIFGD